ncbi:MAG: tagaturonate reductase [Ruminococcaceae bacterium]|nr:tagaturonate reductase [Oscillospiraceae bacterium]
MQKINEIYTKKERKETVIQFGEGGFLRAFCDWMIDTMNKQGLYSGNIVVVQPIEQGMCEMLDKQDCIYTHIIRGIVDGKEKVEKTVIDSISRCVNPYKDYKAFLDLAKNPDFRFVISNTTEAGISYEKEEMLTDRIQKSFPAKVTVLLYERFKNNLDGFVFLPCELIDKNGSTLKKIVLQYADDWNLGEDFKKFVEEKNYFMNTLVDRIVTGYPRGENIDLGYEDNMLDTSEYFHLWVIEGEKSFEDEFPLKKAGLNVIWTNDMSNYRTRKVRILNGAHSSTVAYAMLEGFETVKDCMDDEKMSAFIKKSIFEEIIPTLDLPKEELLDFANAVLDRFKNPYIKHLWSSISLNLVSKFKVRVLPSILEHIKRLEKIPENLVFSLYCLIKLYKEGKGTDDAEVIEFIKNNDIKAILANEKFWDCDLTFLYDEVAKYEN